MNKKLIEEARSLAKGKDPRTAWLDLRSWMHTQGSSAERVAVFTFLMEHSANPAAVHLFPEVLREAAKVSTSLPTDERKTLVELADCASRTIKGDVSMINPKDGKVSQMPLANERPAPMLNFNPSRELKQPSLGSASPLVPSADTGHYFRMRDEMPNTSIRLHEMPSPRINSKEGPMEHEMRHPEELMSFSRPAEPQAMHAGKGEELVLALKEKMRKQGIDVKESPGLRAAKPGKGKATAKKAKRRGRPPKKETLKGKTARAKRVKKPVKKSLSKTPKKRGRPRKKTVGKKKTRRK